MVNLLTVQRSNFYGNGFSQPSAFGGLALDTELAVPKCLLLCSLVFQTSRDFDVMRVFAAV